MIMTRKLTLQLSIQLSRSSLANVVEEKEYIYKLYKVKPSLNVDVEGFLLQITWSFSNS